MKKIFYPLILVCIIITSCSKDKKITPGVDGPSKTGSTLDLIKDSVFLYAQQTYYWNSSLPTYAAFNPRHFSGSNDLDALQTEIDAMTQYSANPNNSNKPYEYYTPAPGSAKYSFIDDGSVSGELNGVKGDFGFAPVWIGDPKDTKDIRVKYVYPGSPADAAGLKRGYQITAINGRTGDGLKYDGNAGDNGTNVNFLINAYTNSNTISLTLKKSDNTTFDVTISTGTYNVNPVLATNVVDAGNNKKVGYIAFNSFTSKENAKPFLDAAFSTFTAQNITDLVVDLRYNGGGYVETAQYLSNLIAPASTNNQTMFSYYFTQKMVDRTATILKNQTRKDSDGPYTLFDFDYTVAGNTIKFSKAGVPALTLNHVFFIVSGSTASASELTINNLIPVMDVQLIGNTTYGKPVGFFNIDINKYEMYIPQFETKNSAGNGGYYLGMKPGDGLYKGKLASDDVTKDFGDPTEGLFAYAINYANKGTYSIPQQQVQSLSKIQTLSVDQTRDMGLKTEGKKEFRGMIYNNKKVKK